MRETPRTTIPFHNDWFFHRGEVGLDALAWGNKNIIANETRVWQKAGNHGIARAGNPNVAEWRVVQLPHDFVLEGDFSPDAPLNNGSLPGDEAWYVKHFTLPESDASRRIRIEFDGVYRNCSVFCNGHFVGRHLSGYTSFGFDITEVCEFGGDNAVAVHVDATENELWSYEGGGIYRTVRLVKTNGVHVRRWGVCVRTGDEDDPGLTQVTVRVANHEPNDAQLDVAIEIVNFQGATVVTGHTPLAVGSDREATTALVLRAENPRMWTLTDPVLYRAVVTLRREGGVVDRFEQPFGYRYFHFDGRTGFHLNGEPIKLQGVCCHQDHAGVGVAVPPSLHAWRLRQLKGLGCNAIRTAHNPPDPALLDACDREGVLVMDELRAPGVAAEHINDLQSLVQRDRNHPSVVMWCLGNEEMRIHDTHAGVRIFKVLKRLANELDPTRPTTYACNYGWIDICDFYRENGLDLGVFSANYRSGQRSANYDDFHSAHPDWPLVGSETWGGAATRGLYEPDNCPLLPGWEDSGWADQRRYVSAYENWHTPWGYSIQDTWRDCDARPFMAGTFIWTGFDYRGETTPYDWPAVLSRFGILDYAGFYKEIAHYLRSWWRPEEPHAFLMPHWNWEGREGETIRVRCYSNADAVELALNGELVGHAKMPRNGCLEWDVPYEPGELRAVGLDASGNAICETTRRTADSPAGITLDLESMPGLIMASATVVDQYGVACPRADHLLRFRVSGPGRLLGLGNGDPLSHEPDRHTNTRRAYHGLARAIVEVNGNPQDVTIEVDSEDGLSQTEPHEAATAAVMQR